MKEQHTFTQRTALLLLASAGILSSGVSYAGHDDQPVPAPTVSSGNFLNSPGTFVPEDTVLRKFYFGAGPGMISTDYADSVNDGSVSMIGGNDEGFAYTVFMGYQFNEFFALEAGFTASDDVDYNAMSDGSGVSWSAGPVSAEYDAEFFTLSGLVRYPVAPRWWMYGKFGVTWWETTETFNESGFISTQTDDGTEIFLGLGLEYDVGLDERIIYRFELGYQPVGGDDNLDIYSAAVAVRYEFP